MTRCSPGARSSVKLAVLSVVCTASATKEKWTLLETAVAFVAISSLENVAVSTTTGTVRPTLPESASAATGGTKEPSEVIWSLMTAYAKYGAAPETRSTFT